MDDRNLALVRAYSDGYRHAGGDNPPETIYQGVGCTECRGIGYRGRTGVFELLPMNAELRRLLNARAGEDAILAAARGSGLSTLSEEALKLVREGTTTLEEVARVFHEVQLPVTQSEPTIDSEAV